jgi:hypothetical protein
MTRNLKTSHDVTTNTELQPNFADANIPAALGSSVGIMPRYGMHCPGIESWWGARFSVPVQTGLGGQPASCTKRTVSFPRRGNAAGAWR